MHKQKAIAVRDVKNTITILSVDRTATGYVNFELQGAQKEEKEGGGDKATGGGYAQKEAVADVPLRSAPPVVTDMWQPNSYTKPLFEALGFKDKNACYTLQEVHNTLEKYIETKLVKAETADGKAGPPTAASAVVDVSDAGAATAGAPTSAEAAAEVSGLLRRIGMSADTASTCASSLAADGYDSLPSLKAGNMEVWEYTGYGMSDGEAEALIKEVNGTSEVGQAVKVWMVSVGVSEAEASSCAMNLAKDGYDSLDALIAGNLTAASLVAKYNAPSDTASTLASAMAKLSIKGSPKGVEEGGGDDESFDFGAKKKKKSKDKGEKAAAEPTTPVDVGDSDLGLGTKYDRSNVPLDELLLTSLVKLAGGTKKGVTLASHVPLAELKESMRERMTPFHRVEVEGEAPFLRKGALKLIMIEMKRAAGHNKTHVSGLESFCISPQSVADALKVKLGCTTAVLKLPGNNVKDMEVLLQGHCVDEVVAYLRDVYCIDKQWIELKLKEDARKTNR